MLCVAPVCLWPQSEGQRRGLLLPRHGQVHRDGAGLAEIGCVHDLWGIKDEVRTELGKKCGGKFEFPAQDKSMMT